MKEFNDSLFTKSRKAPHLHFNEYNRYRFETPDDTGTGSNYTGMVVYDLTVLYLTALPAISHDSLILKKIGDGGRHHETLRTEQKAGVYSFRQAGGLYAGYSENIS